MFGLSAEKLILLALLAVLIIGPERLPHYSKQLAEWIKKARRMVDNAQTQMKSELGDGFEDLDWKKLDPRQYDPTKNCSRCIARATAPAKCS